MKVRRSAPASYEMIDHTADLGVVVGGESLPDLFASAGMVLGELLYDPALVEEDEKVEVSLKAESSEQLLVMWLNELLYHREVGEFLWTALEVEMEGGTRLDATLLGEVFRPERHVPRRGFKAATYHQLRISREGDVWSARIIFDL